MSANIIHRLNTSTQVEMKEKKLQRVSQENEETSRNPTM